MVETSAPERPVDVPLEEPQIAIYPWGRMANRMFQMMLAAELRRRAGVGRIVGYSMPRWDLVSPPVDTIDPPYAVLQGHRFDLDHAAYLLRTGAARTIVIAGWGMRLGYYGPPQRYRGLFRTSARGQTIGDDELLIHVRADDILNLHHPRYFPMPFSFYESVIASTGLRPVFIGQIGADAYSAALKRRFAGAKFLDPQSAIEDFTTIRKARHIVLSVSSFGWLAAWLSETVVSVQMPVSGLFDPRNGATFLLPLGDRRYRFHAIGIPAPEAREGLDLVAWAERAEAAGALSDEQLQALALSPLE
jgi:hypothetical protein